MDWYYIKDGRQFGPVPEGSIRAWLESGFLLPEDLVWRDGLPEWSRVGDLTELGGRAERIPGAGGLFPVEAPPAGIRAFGGFWLRLAAYVVDSLVLTAILLPFWYQKILENPDPMNLQQDTRLLLTSFLLSLVYYSILESSPWQATLGKRLFRLRVTDLHGRRLSLGRASLRQAAKVLSGLPLNAGYVLAGLTPRKQALHDLLTRCLVVRD